MKFHQAICLLFFILHQIHAQTPTVSFTKLVRNDGGLMLFDNTNNFYQDHRGFLWIMTDGGLYRYDGHTMKHFRADPIDLNSLSSNRINNMKEDAEGRFWITTYDGGLNQYDPKKGKFTHFQHNPDDPISVSANLLTAIEVDETGKFWIGSTNGLNHFDPKTGKTFRYQAQRNTKGKLQGTYVGRIFVTPDRIYLNTDRGFEYLDRKTQQFRFFPIVTTKGDTIPLGSCKTLRDSKGRIWMGTPGLPQLRVYDPATDKIDISATITLPNISNDYFIRGLIEDKKGRLWICTQHHILRISTDRKQVEYCLHISDLEKLKPDKVFWSIYEDHQGIIWLGMNDRKSVYYFDPRQELFQRTALPNLKFPNEWTRLLFENDGTLWAATENNLYRYDTKTQKTQAFNEADVTVIRQAAPNKLFLGKPTGLFLFDAKTGKNKEVTANKKSFGHVLGVKFDNDGDLWVSTWGEGLYHIPKSALNKNTDNIVQFYQWKNIAGDPNSLQGNELQHILVTQDNTVYVSGYHSGLTKVDKKTRLLQTYLYKQGNSDGISSNYTVFMSEDKMGYIWVGTHQNGLNRFSPQTGKFKQYNTANGIPDDLMMEHQIDAEGNIWINSRRGLVCLNPKTDSVRVYGQNTDFGAGNGPIAFNPLTGDVYFNARDGLRYFSPSAIRNLPHKKVKVEIIDIAHFNPNKREMQPVHPADWDRGMLSLSHLDNTIELTFSMLDLQDATQSTYAYSLVQEGAKPEWVSLGNKNSIQFTQLAAGNYTFLLRGDNGKGQEAILERPFKIIIRHPWWNTWAAWAIYALILGAAIWWVNRFLINQQREQQKNENLKRLVIERETMLREIHHRVKNNLQIISGLFDKQSRQTTDEATRKLMKEGQDRVFSIALVHQNLYESDNLTIIQIKSYLETLTQNIEKSQRNEFQDIALKLDVDDSVLDIDTAIPLGLILNELITNCYKYAFKDRTKGEIQIRFRQMAKEIVLGVQDNGMGLPQNFDIDKTKSLGINLVRGLVRQLDGKLDFTSSVEGTTFTIYCIKQVA